MRATQVALFFQQIKILTDGDFRNAGGFSEIDYAYASLIDDHLQNELLSGIHSIHLIKRNEVGHTTAAIASCCRVMVKMKDQISQGVLGAPEEEALSLLSRSKKFRLQDLKITDSRVIIARHQDIQHGINSLCYSLCVNSRHNLTPGAKS